MDSFLIEGPSRIEGSIEASGAKNAALPALAAVLLTNDPVELEGLPNVQDIRTMRRLLERLGVTEEIAASPAAQLGASNAASGLAPLRLRAGDVDGEAEAPYELVRTMRASILLLGPTLARHGRARVSLPGGCAIGVRPVDQHLAGLEALGATVTLETGYVSARASRLRGALFRFREPTVTGTENLMMASTLAKGTTVLDNCAREPEIVDLANLLRTLGAKIEGDGSERIVIEGVDALHGGRHRIVGDRIEAGTYLIGAVLTRGDLIVRGARPEHLTALLEKLHENGAQVAIDGQEIRVRHSGPIRARDVVTAPHPGFPTDLQAQYLALMTQAEGSSTLCETVFENRFQHIPELNRMGAHIEIDGANARTRGPTQLSGTSVMATDLRASACLVLAGLAANGTTRVDRIYHLDRGYENMESKLQHLGCRVRRLTNHAPA